MFGGVDVIIHP